MDIYITLKTEINAALRKKEIRDMLPFFRSLDAKIQLTAKESNKKITNDLCVSVLKKMIKQNQESLMAYEKANREDMVEKLGKENMFMKGLLPRQLSESETITMIDKVIAELEASSIKDMGKVMGKLKGEAGSQLDMKLASAKVKEKLL